MLTPRNVLNEIFLSLDVEHQIHELEVMLGKQHYFLDGERKMQPVKLDHKYLHEFIFLPVKTLKEETGHSRDNC
jgi:hypothetical protein